MWLSLFNFWFFQIFLSSRLASRKLQCWKTRNYWLHDPIGKRAAQTSKFLCLLSSGFSRSFAPYLLSCTPHKWGDTRSWKKRRNICWRQLNARYDTRRGQSICFCIRRNMSIWWWGHEWYFSQVSFFYKYITYQLKNVERPHKFRPSPHPQVEPLCNWMVVRIGGFKEIFFFNTTCNVWVMHALVQ